MFIFFGGGTVSFGVAVVWLAAFGGWWKWMVWEEGKWRGAEEGRVRWRGDGEAFEPGHYIWGCLGKVAGWVWCWYG